MASVNDEDVMTFVKEEDAVDSLLRTQMLEIINGFDYYKGLYGSGKEKKGAYRYGRAIGESNILL